MPAGLPYFAWIDPTETTFDASHMRWDEQVFSFTLEQSEGDPANLTIAVRRPRNASGDPIGLLGPGRKIWAWFALDCGPSLIKFRGRLVGVPTSIFEELVTLEFVAKPIDLVAQKQALAESLRVLPHYDPVVIEPSRRDDPDLVLEGYTKIWHYDRETHIITVSDEITGEDGLVEFDGISEDGKVFYDGLNLQLTGGPLARVDVVAEYNWTQQGYGTVDLTRYLVNGWPGNYNGTISSYTMGADNWPKVGASLGDGWEVASASAYDTIDLSSITRTSTVTSRTRFPDGETHSCTQTSTVSSVKGNTTMLAAGPTVSSNKISITYSTDGDGHKSVSSFSRSNSVSVPMVAMQTFVPTLVAGYSADRAYTERISFSLLADIQSILTDPEDGEALRIDDIQSVNLSDASEGTPIGNPLRRSYIATARGNQSLEHLIALARAHLMKRARVIEIGFAPKLSRMAEVTLRKNASLFEPRVGQAEGKIIGYSIALDGADGQIKCEVRIGCTIGRGGLATETTGTPTYCEVAYTGFDYQQFVGRTILPGSFDSSVGYEPPLAAADDDSINFLGSLTTADVIEIPLAVTNGAADQETAIQEGAAPWEQTGAQEDGDDVNDAGLNAKNDMFKAMLKQLETRATFKLKSVKGKFSTDYAIQVTDLKIPTGYNLETI